MRLIICIFIVFLSFCLAWQLGKSAHGSAGNMLIFTAVIAGAFVFLTRRLCFRLSAASLFIGIAGSSIVWFYGSVFISGDSSGYGMLGTLLAFIFIPAGIGLAFVGWTKSE